VKKLLRQIRREAARSPQKAAVLGLLALVAIWFWAPLVMGWVQGEPKKKPEAAAEENTLAGLEFAVPTVAPAGQPTSTAKEEEATGPGDWQELIVWLESDPKTDPAGAAAPARDPFVAIDFPPVHVSLLEEARENQEEEKPKPPELKPKDLGLALTSTLVGPGGGLALIGGKKYRLGEKVVVAHESQTVEFTLAEVHPRRAVLTRGEKSYDLSIPRPDGTEEINHTP
jgi:hypothetical protein